MAFFSFLHYYNRTQDCFLFIFTVEHEIVTIGHEIVTIGHER